jgi:hypothetical protein
VNWTNFETEAVADMIRSDNSAQETIQGLIVGVIHGTVDEHTVAQSVSVWFCGMDDAGNLIVDEEYAEAFELLKIDPGNIDWLQLARWQIAKAHERN